MSGFDYSVLTNNTPYGVLLVMDNLSAVLTSLSHPSRRAILEHLTRGPARFTDIAAQFHTAVNAVTKHLKLLERAGLIERTKKGREVLISFRAEPLREVSGWVHHYERFWNQRLDEFAQNFGVLEEEKEKNDGRNEKDRGQTGAQTGRGS